MRISCTYISLNQTCAFGRLYDRKYKDNSSTAVLTGSPVSVGFKTTQSNCQKNKRSNTEMELRNMDCLHVRAGLNAPNMEQKVRFTSVQNSINHAACTLNFKNQFLLQFYLHSTPLTCSCPQRAKQQLMWETHEPPQL